MKKKLLIAVLLCFVLALPAQGFSFGGGSTVAPRERLMVYEVENTTGDYQATAIPLWAIPVGSRIYGVNIFSVDPSLNAEHVVGLYDTITDLGNTFSEIVAEAENPSSTDITIRWFDYPLPIVSRLIITQGANTKVLIYYSRL